MFTTIICVAFVIAGCVGAHWLSSAYEDYKEYYETQDKRNGEY